jgi:hypothetical protein
MGSVVFSWAHHVFLFYFKNQCHHRLLPMMNETSNDEGFQTPMMDEIGNDEGFQTVLTSSL